MNYEKIVNEYLNAYKVKKPSALDTTLKKWHDLLIEVLQLINGEIITTSIISTKIFPMLQNKPGKLKGSKNSEGNIKNQLRVIYNFASWQLQQEQKGEQQLSFISEATPENMAKVQQPHRGRPRSTQNTEKISLYITKDVVKDLGKLSEYDEVKINTLLNSIITDYLAKRQSDIDFINEQAEAKRLRKQQQEITN